MSKYTGIPCEHCGHPFEKDDDVVVCPECGAPHHRSCYREFGRCALSERHAPDFEWSAPAAARRSPEEQEQHTAAVCPQCSTVNPGGSTSCRLCGSPLEPSAHSEGYGQSGYHRLESFPESEDGQSADPFFASLEAWEIDGVSSRELAGYTGNSSFYFLYQFPRLLKSRWKLSWNWSAFFFQPFYLLYRRLYLPGFLLLAVLTAAMIPELLYTFEVMKPDVFPQLYGVTLPVNAELMAQLEPLLPIMTVLQVILRLLTALFCGLFSNRMILKKAVADIKQIRSRWNAENTRDYYTALYFYGRPSILTVLAAFSLFFMLFSLLLSRSLGL